jgi:ketosteroid isomerase-like protein
MSSIRRTIAISAVSLCCLTGFSFAAASAQEATPAGSADCAVTTPQDNIALVENLSAALEEGDAETADLAMADDLVYELDRYGLEHDTTTNDDEVAMAVTQEEFYPESAHVINEIIAAENKVVVHQTLTIVEHNITGETVELEETLEIDMILIYTIECGEVVHIHGVVDELGLMQGLGIVPPIGGQATPES